MQIFGLARLEVRPCKDLIGPDDPFAAEGASMAFYGAHGVRCGA